MKVLARTLTLVIVFYGLWLALVSLAPAFLGMIPPQTATIDVGNIATPLNNAASINLITWPLAIAIVFFLPATYLWLHPTMGTIALVVLYLTALHEAVEPLNFVLRTMRNH